MKTKIKPDGNVEERVQALQMRVLVNIEKRQWKAARRNSSEIGRLLWVRAKRQVKHIKALPIFSKQVELDEKAKAKP